MTRKGQRWRAQVSLEENQVHFLTTSSEGWKVVLRLPMEPSQASVPTTYCDLSVLPPDYPLVTFITTIADALQDIRRALVQVEQLEALAKVSDWHDL